MKSTQINKMGKKGVLLVLLLVLSLYSVSAQSYDVISNGAEWFVCNADNSAGPFGAINPTDNSDNYISNLQTFTPKYDNGRLSCLEVMQEYVNEDYTICENPPFSDCCFPNPGRS